MKKVFIIDQEGKKVPYYALATKYVFRTNKKYAVFMSEVDYNKKTGEKILVTAEIKRVNGIDFKFHEIDQEGKKVVDYLIDRISNGQKNKVKIRNRAKLIVVNDEKELNEYLIKHNLKKRSLLEMVIEFVAEKANELNSIYQRKALPAGSGGTPPRDPNEPYQQGYAFSTENPTKQDIVYYLELVDEKKDVYQLKSETGRNYFSCDIDKLLPHQLKKIKEQLLLSPKNSAYFFGNRLPKDHDFISGRDRTKISEAISKNKHNNYNHVYFYENHKIIGNNNGILDLMSIPVELTNNVTPVAKTISEPAVIKPIEPVKETVLLLFENDVNKTAFQKHLVVEETENTFERIENQGIYTANTPIRNIESYIRRGNIELLDGKAKILSGHSFSTELDRTLIKAQTIKPIRTLLSKDKKIIEYKDYTLEELLEIQTILLDYPFAKTK